MTNQPNDYSMPWRMDCERGWISVVDNQAREVCYLEAYDEGDQERQLENARLLKAAPEMYYMLYNILNDLETGEYISIADNTATDIRGLLAKVRGEGDL